LRGFAWQQAPRDNCKYWIKHGKEQQRVREDATHRSWHKHKWNKKDSVNYWRRHDLFAAGAPTKEVEHYDDRYGHSEYSHQCCLVSYEVWIK
jgi:hypothetical protein